MHRSVLETIGSPLVQVSSPPGSIVAAKLESRNPGGSAKDRPALYMIEAAEDAGALDPGGHVVEATSGNTGIGLAMVAAVKGYDLTVVMPEEKSVERRRIMAAYGANIELTPGSDIATAKDRANELEADAGMVQLRQFENEANVAAHYHTTGPEIIDQVGEHTVDALVAGIGTGGTITGTGRRLRETFPEVRIVGVQPSNNQFLTGDPGRDDFQGMGPGFVSDILDVDLLDAVETVRLADAEAECRRLAREEGLFVGQSSGASNLAAKRVADRLADPALECPDAPNPDVDLTSTAGIIDADVECPVVVTVFWDSGERYMSTDMFETDPSGAGYPNDQV